MLALDPGETTGWATRESSGEVVGLKAVWLLLQEVVPTRIYCERFIGGHRANQSPAWVIGVLKLYQELYGADLIMVQPPRRTSRRNPSHAAVAEAILEERC